MILSNEILLRVTLFLFLLLAVFPPLSAQPRSAAPQPLTAAQMAQQQAMLDDATLRAVQMIGPQVVYACGDQGAIRKSVDGGLRWSLLSSPVACRWNSLCFLTDRIGWIAGGTLTVNGRETQGCLLSTMDGGQNWKTVVPSGVGMIHEVKFFDLQHGILCGESTTTGTAGIWRTEDGGKNWQAIMSTQREAWQCAAFGSFEGGVVAGLRGNVGLLGGNRLMTDRSLNLGMKGIHDITLDSSAQGWLVGDGGLVRYSPAGAAWQDPPGPLPAELKTIFDFLAVAQKENSVWIVGHPGSAVWSTHDGGLHWHMTPTGSHAPLQAISFADKQHGCTVGELGTILRTEDGGRSWHNSTAQSRRLAVLQYVPRAEESSFCLTARYGGHHGYRTGVIALCQTDSAPAFADRAAESLRLQQGVSLAGGNVGEVSWALPVDLPELEQNQQLLIERWNRATDGELSDLVLSHFVRDLRTYRPTVLVFDKAPENDQASQLLRSAITNAIRSAADPTWLISQQQYAALSPWKVQRVFERSRSGQGGEVILDASDYLAGLNQSVRMAAAPAYQQMQGTVSQIPLTESFHLSETSENPGKLHLTDLLTGIILGPGSEARRPWLPQETEKNSAGETLAKHQRNFSAYARTLLADERHGAQVIAQLNDVVGNAPRRQAVLQLLELAEKYRANAQWDYYETVLMQIIESYPAEPTSAAAAAQLIPFWSSQEMTQLRLKNRNTSVATRQIDSSQFQSQFEEILQTAAEYPEIPAAPITPAIQNIPEKKALTAGSRQDRSSWEATWQQRAISVYRYLEKTSPELARSPEVQLSLASLYRRKGASRGVQEVYQTYLNASAQAEGDRPTLQQIAENEFWLQSRSGLTPRLSTSSYPVIAPPYLDGLLSEECWRDAEEIRLKFSTSSAAGSAASTLERPIVMLAHDAEYLYLAGSFPRHPALPADLPSPGKRQHDADLTGYDRVQLAIDLDRDYQSSYILEVDQRGLTHDTCWLDKSWNPQWFVACQGDDTHWRVELAIPLAELLGNRPLQAGEAWSISLARILPGVGVQSWGEQLQSLPGRAAYGLLLLR